MSLLQGHYRRESLLRAALGSTLGDSKVWTRPVNVDSSSRTSQGVYSITYINPVKTTTTGAGKLAFTQSMLTEGLGSWPVLVLVTSSTGTGMVIQTKDANLTPYDPTFIFVEAIGGKYA